MVTEEKTRNEGIGPMVFGSVESDYVRLSILVLQALI